MVSSYTNRGAPGTSQGSRDDLGHHRVQAPLLIFHRRSGPGTITPATPATSLPCVTPPLLKQHTRAWSTKPSMFQDSVVVPHRGESPACREWGRRRFFVDIARHEDNTCRDHSVTADMKTVFSREAPWSRPVGRQHH